MKSTPLGRTETGHALESLAALDDAAHQRRKVAAADRISAQPDVVRAPERAHHRAQGEARAVDPVIAFPDEACGGARRRCR